MDYIELEITVEPRQPASDLFIAQLAEAGFESFQDTDHGFLAYIPSDQFDQSLTDTALSNGMKGLELKVEKRTIGYQNWNEEWEKNFQPVEIDGKVRIRAPFHPSISGFEHELTIQPQQSFGTGHHQTTRLMIQKLLTMPMDGRYILDMGCGTGILGILCSRMGASHCIGVDIEDNAARNAEENCRLNHVKNMEIRVGVETSVHGMLFDILIANINKNILKAAMEAYSKLVKKDGSILLSGFFTTDTDELTQCGEANGFLLHDKNEFEGWALLHLVKQ